MRLGGKVLQLADPDEPVSTPAKAQGGLPPARAPNAAARKPDNPSKAGAKAGTGASEPVGLVGRRKASGAAAPRHFDGSASICTAKNGKRPGPTPGR